MKSKSYSLVHNATRDEVQFLFGSFIGSREREEESLIIVVSDRADLSEWLQGMLGKPFCKDMRLTVAHGVGRVEEAITFYAELGKVHVVYYMPGRFIYSEKNEVSGLYQMVGLPVKIVSDTIRRQICDPRVTTATMFVDEEQENV